MDKNSDITLQPDSALEALLLKQISMLQAEVATIKDQQCRLTRPVAAGRKAYQTRLKRGNWMKPRKRYRPNWAPPAGVLGVKGRAIPTGNMEIPRPRPRYQRYRPGRVVCN